MPPAKIILDLDNGLTGPVQDVDDALALGLALTSPEFELLGCTTCPGNCTAAASTANTLGLLEAAGAHAVPVAAGGEAPLRRDRAAHFAYLAAKRAGAESRFWQGLPPPPPPHRPPHPLPAHAFIVRQVQAHPGEVRVVALGSLTNLARALQTAPEIAPLLAGVTHMGGMFHAPGGGPVWRTPDIPDHVWRTTLRFNTLFDPEAAALVFRSGVPVTLLTANVTARVFWRPEHQARLARQPGGLQRHLHRWTAPWLEWSREVRGIPGAHLHDPLTLGVVLDPGFCRWAGMQVDVDRLLAEDPDWLGWSATGVAVQAAVDVEAGRFEDFLAERLQAPVPPRYRTPTGP